MEPYRKDLKNLGRMLRSNLTDAERLLWQKLRYRQMAGLHFYRQKPLFEYIVDFYCPAAKVVIELDGSQHQEGQALRQDKQRDETLARIGLLVLRFNDREVLRDTHAVLEKIYEVVTERAKKGDIQIPPGPPFSKGGE